MRLEVEKWNHFSTTNRRCSTCFVAYTKTKGHPECEIPKKQIKRKLCECGVLYISNHKCGYTKCTHCQTFYSHTSFIHRCPLFYNDRSEKKNKYATSTSGFDGSFPALIAYDFESCFSTIDSHRVTPQTFGTDGSGRYDGSVATYAATVERHSVDLVRAKVFVELIARYVSGFTLGLFRRSGISLVRDRLCGTGERSVLIVVY